MKKLEGFLILLILLLCGFMVYEYNQPQGGGRNSESEIIAATDNTIALTEDESLATLEISPQTETDEEQAAEETKQTEQETNTSSVLPTAYDGRVKGKAPIVKNQGELWTCWAVATSSALEAVLLPDDHMVFSADHISLKNDFNKTQEDGGAYIMAISYLTSWRGPVLEEEDPYGDGYSPDGLTASKHVQEIRLFQNKDYDRIKRAVYEYGAVQSALFMDMQDQTFESPYYDSAQYTYCYPGAEEANHDVLIIGWDDEYPAEKFTSNPGSNGAFICQNSWGETFGEGGIFYVSYEDAVIGNNCVAYARVEDVDNYDNIYQSDLCGWVGKLGYGSEECYIANVYEAKEAEELKAVGFYAVGENTKYEIGVVSDFLDESSLTNAMLSQSGMLDSIGYYTVDLEEPIVLEKGSKFAIVLKITTPGEEYPVAAEYPADQITENVDITDGEGYLSANGNIWSQAEEQYQCNLCLKAYTSFR